MTESFYPNISSKDYIQQPPTHFNSSAPPPPYEATYYTPTLTPLTNICFSSPSRRNCMCAVVSVALLLFTVLATHYCLVNGLTTLDMATSNLHTFGGAALIYMGLAFSCVAAGNALFAGYKLCFSPPNATAYTPKFACQQIAISLFAPIAAIPVALCYATRHVLR